MEGMMEYGLVVAYLACCGLAWIILVDAWRRDWDLTRIDALIFGIFSLMGPAALAVACLVWASGSRVAQRGKSKPLWRKK